MQMTTFSIENRSIDSIRAYENNPRKNDHAVADMVKVIDEFGFRIPMLIKSDGEIIDGHLRYKAALALGLESVPVVCVDDLSPEQIRAFRLLANRSATWADWDDEALLVEIKKLLEADYDISFTGFSQRELDSMLMDIGSTKEKDFDDVPAIPEKPLTSFGEVWLLGKHRLMCGDSTSLLDITTLVENKNVDMIWTDPPYNVNYEGTAGKIKNDKMSAEKFDTFLFSLMKNCYEILRAGGAIYVAHAEAGDGMAFRRAFINAGFKLAACLIWRKQTATLGRSDYQFMHEPILYGWKKGVAHKWYGDRKQRSVFEFELENVHTNEDGSLSLLIGGSLYKITGENIQLQELEGTIIPFAKPAKSELHPTMKPVGLVQKMISNSSPKGGIVFDPCGGSGSTLMACETLGRTCRTMELDPKFAEVIVRRWEEYTGQTAYRASDNMTLVDLQG